MQTQPGRGMPKLLACAMYFVVLGTFVGFVVFWITVAVDGGGASLSDVLGAAGFGALSSAALFPLALPIGAPPALLAGLIYFAARHRAAGVPGRVLVVTVVVTAGAVISAMWGATVFEHTLSVLNNASYWRTFAIPGAVGALVCALTADRFIRATVA